MMKPKTFLFVLGSSIAVGYATYKVLLTDEAKESLKTGVRVVVDGYKELRATLEDHYGVVIEEQRNRTNAEETAREWEALGF